MAKTIKIDDLANEIVKTLQDFSKATDEIVEEAIKTTSKKTVEELKQANPPGSGEFGSWKEYNQSWKVMQTKTDKRYHKKATIHNQKHYRLTHLLEKGHALVGGGRTRAFPHIMKAEEKAEEMLMEIIRKGV